MPTMAVNGTELSFRVQGGGDPVLMIPGLGRGMDYYDLGEPLLRQGFTTILVEPRGVAGSPSDQSEFGAEQWADDFAHLLRGIGHPRAHVLGSSHGGCMVMAMAVRHPAVVVSLSLVGAFSELDTLMRLNFELRVGMVGKLGMSEEIAKHVAIWTMSHRFLDDRRGQAMAATLPALMQRGDPARYVALNRSILAWGRCLPGQEHEPKWTEAIRAIRAPTLALTGDDDHFIPARMSRIIADAIPGAEYAEIAGCGHIPFLEKPEETAAAVAGFLRRQPIKAGASAEELAS